MRITKVNATAFGPFTDATVEFAPGLTLVFGPNESGKSTLHAATSAALCGRKRGRGAATAADREFKRQHMPWDGRGWSVGSEIALADGRRVALTHDLLAKVDSRAVDADLGTDLSGEIMHQGAPDGAKFLGLNRDSFGAVAVVNQAQLLAILAKADDLQQVLQRAAASSAGERPAAAAIAAIDAFHSEHVGSNQATTKPLRKALAAEAQARADLQLAQEAHAGYLRLLEDADSAEAAAAEAGRAAGEARDALERAVLLDTEAKELARLRSREARARKDAEAARQRYQEAREDAEQAKRLHDRFGGVEPKGLGDGEQLAQRVGAALEHWQHAPQVPALTGPTATELQALIDALPQPPDGDVAVHPQVEAAAESLATARRSAQRRTVVPQPEQLSEAEARAQQAGTTALRELALGIEGAPDLAAAREEEQRLAARLADTRAVRDAAEAERTEVHTAWQTAEASLRDAEQAVSDARLAAAAPASSLNVPMLVVGAVLALSGAALLGVQAVLGGALLLAGAAVAVVALRTGRKSAPHDPVTGPVAAAVSARDTARQASHRAKAALDEAEQRLQRAGSDVAAAEARAAVVASSLHTAEQQWARLHDRCAAAGVPVDVAELRRLATRVDAWQRQHDDHQHSLRAVQADQQDIEEAEHVLGQALAGRGATGAGTLAERLTEYRQACTARAEQAEQARRRPALEANLEQRQANEANAQRAARSRREAFEALAAAAVAAGAAQPAEELHETDAGRLTAALQRWNSARAAALAQSQQDIGDWARLQGLLDGGTLENLLAALQSQRTELEQLDDAAAAAAAAVRGAEERVAALAAAAGLDPAAAAAPEGLTIVADHLTLARAEESSATEEAGKLRLEAGKAQTRAKVRADGLLPVADAESELAAAVAELQRVRQLGTLLETTRGFLTEAQQRVHRDIAPVLAKSIEGRLATVTGDRYTRVRIDPKTLKVQVAPPTGDFRDADQVSFGTTEQIYLLVRIALAEMLGTSDEPCPLLLDDVTVHADGIRTPAILQTLLALTQERQIILFSQEDDVLAWAEANLTDDSRHRIITLDPVPANG